MKNKNGFTLIELLAVIIILGILMIIAIPSVTQYINNSRKSAYVDTAKEIIAGARNLVNKGELEMFSTETTYYIPASMIGTENGQKSPYGDFTEAYVVVTYDGKGYNYYWISVDETGQGVKNITRLDKLDEDDIESDIKASDITSTVNNTGIGGRKIVNVLQDGNAWDTKTENAINNVSEEGEGGSVTPPEPTAASTILATAHTAGQLNQIPDTNIYIFKGENPANYVKFNNEDWRIIGIYGNQLKIQRVAGIAHQQWNTSTPNPGWANSSIKTYLNETYYNTLSETAKSMIDANGSWNVGVAAYNVTASQAYTNETTTSTLGSTTHTTPWRGKVGLMTTYEFLYASNGSGCDSVAGNTGSFDTTCGKTTNDWMTPNDYSWSISPCGDSANYTLYVNPNGYIGCDDVNKSNYGVLPAVFLKSSISIASGTGTSGSPYVLQ